MKRQFNLMLCLFLYFGFVSCSKKQANEHPAPLTAKGKIASCLSLAAIPNHGFAISWALKDSLSGKEHFYFSRWNDEKASFSSPVAVPLEKGVSYNEQNRPMIIFKSPDTLWALYSVHRRTVENKYAGFVHYCISTNGGQDWSAPESLLHDTIPGKSRSYANGILLPDGNIGIAWMGGMLNMQIHGRPLYYTEVSRDGRFMKPVLIDSYACPCCRNALVVTPEGKVAIAYRSVRPQNIRDIAFSYKAPGKKTFSKPVVFSEDHWQIDACPEDGPSLVITNKKNWVGWFTGAGNSGVFYACLSNQGKVLQKQKVQANSKFIRLARLSGGKNAVIYNETMKMGGMDASIIALRRSESELLPPQELDTAGYFASNPVLMPQGDGSSLMTAWLAQGRVWYRSVP